MDIDIHPEKRGDQTATLCVVIHGCPEGRGASQEAFPRGSVGTRGEPAPADMTFLACYRLPGYLTVPREVKISAAGVIKSRSTRSETTVSREGWPSPRFAPARGRAGESSVCRHPRLIRTQTVVPGPAESCADGVAVDDGDLDPARAADQGDERAGGATRRRSGRARRSVPRPPRWSRRPGGASPRRSRRCW